MPIITNRDAAARALQQLVDRVAGHAVDALAAGGYRAPDERLATVETELATAQGAAARAERDAVALRGELRDTRRAHATDTAQLSARHDAEVQRWSQRASDAGQRLSDVWEVLLQEHGRSDLLRDSDLTVAAAVRAALTDTAPLGEEITDRIAEIVWQTGQQAPAAQHAFLSQPACREIAFALAPAVADWLRRTVPDEQRQRPDPERDEAPRAAASEATS